MADLQKRYPPELRERAVRMVLEARAEGFFGIVGIAVGTSALSECGTPDNAS